MTAISTRADISAFEETPLSEHHLPQSTFEFLEQGANHGLDRPALTFFLQAKGDSYKNGLTFSFGELLGNIRQTANMFRALGIESEEVVSYVLPNLPETHFTLWGGECAGIANPINPLLEADVIKEILQAAGTKVLVTISPFPNTDLWEKIDSIRHEIPSLQTILRINLEDYVDGINKYLIKGITFGKRRSRKVAGQQILNFNQYRKSFPTDRFTFERSIQSGDLASYFHTGGTTGLPKLAKHTHGNEVFDAWSGLQAGGVTDKNKVFFCGLPLFHVNGVTVTGLGPWGQGCHVVLGTPQGYRGEGLIPNFWKIVEHYQVNFFSGVPTVYAALLNVPIGQTDISSLDFALCGAAPMPMETFRNFEKATGMKILEGYGCTEGTCVSSVNPPYGERKVGSVGFPIPYQEMKILKVSDTGTFEGEAAIDEIGAVCIRGANVFPGYKNEAHNEQIWIDTGDGGAPFYHTGDLGRMDAAGYFWLTGRKKELIIRGGHNIDPGLIEEPLVTHPAVAMAAAIGRPDAYAGEVPVAYVTLLEGASATPEELHKYAAEHIGERAAHPKQIIIVDELPLTAVGKIFKPQLLWGEIKLVFEQEIAKLPSVAAADVWVRPHANYGVFAHIEVLANPTYKFEAVKNEISHILGTYSYRYEINEKQA